MHSSSNNRRCLGLRDRMSTGRITMIHEQETKRAAASRQTSVRCGACGKDTNGRRPSAPNIPSSNSGETQRKQSAASRLPELPRAQLETTDAKILSSWMYSSCGFGSAGLYQTGVVAENRNTREGKCLHILLRPSLLYDAFRSQGPEGGLLP